MPTAGGVAAYRRERPGKGNYQEKGATVVTQAGFVRPQTLIMVALSAALLLGAASMAGAGAVTLNVWSGYPEMQPFYQKVAADYTALHPNVKINILTHPLREFEQKLSTTIPAGTVAEVVEISTYAMQKFIETGWVPPNPPEIDAFVRSKVYNRFVVPNLSYQGKTYGVPLFQGRQVMFWNRKMFREAGLGHAPTNWDEVIAYARKLARYDTAGNLTRSGISLRLSGGGSGVAEKWWFWLYPAGGTIIEQTPDGKYRAGYNNEAGRDALKLYVDLVNKYRVDDPAIKHDAEAFALEQTAMFTRESWVVGYMRDNAPKVEYDTAPLPRYRRAGTIMNLVNLYVTQTARDPEVAWDFVKFTVQPKYQQMLAGMVGWLPVREDVDYTPVVQQAPQYKAFLELPEGYDLFWYLPIAPFDEVMTRLAERWLVPNFVNRSLVDNDEGIARVIDGAARETNSILQNYGMLGR